MKKIAKNIIGQLLQKPEFAQSEKYKDLLLYLQDCYEEQYIPSEIDIAAKILGRTENFDPTTDASVRVLVSKLRKKLDTYYNQAGKHEKIRVSIPRRQYALEFKESRTKAGGTSTIQLLVFSTVTVILLALLLVTNLKYNRIKQIVSIDPDIAKKHFLWNDFINNKKNSILTIGHIFSYCEYQDDVNCFRIVRNRLINSQTDLDEYSERYEIPTENIWLPLWDSVPKYAVKYFKLIQSIHPEWYKSLTMEVSTKVAWSDFINNNIIYVGHYHNLGKLDQFYQSKYFYSPSLNTDYSELSAQLARNIEIKSDSMNNVADAIKNQIETLFVLYHKDARTDSLPDVYKFNYDEKSNYVRDYVILSKIPGPETSNILFIISFHQIGRLEVINLLTQPKQMVKFEEQIREITPEIPKYFEMLIEVNGYKETAMKTKILHFYEMDSDFLLN